SSSCLTPSIPTSVARSCPQPGQTYSQSTTAPAARNGAHTPARSPYSVVPSVERATPAPVLQPSGASASPAPQPAQRATSCPRTRTTSTASESRPMGAAEAAATRVGEAEDLPLPEPDARGIEPDANHFAVDLGRLGGKSLARDEALPERRVLPQLEERARSRIAAEESGQRDRLPHAEGRPFQAVRAMEHEGRVDARAAPE